MAGWLDNYNDSKESAPEGFQGDGYSNVGRNSSPAWGGQFQMGGVLPGAVGHMYARHGAPSEGKYAKKTLPSAQNGQEMQYYREGLDWKPKTISQDGTKVDYHTGDKVTYGTPEYKEAYDRGEVVTDQGEYSPIALDEVVIQNNYKRPRGFWEQYRDKIVDENKDAGVLGAIIGTPISAITSLPQLAATYAMTDKVQRPSEAMDIQNPYGAMVTDAVLDPANLVGAGVLTKEKALARLAASKESGLLSNAYKLNPKAFKLNEENLYRQIGESGYTDAIESGVIRSADIQKYPNPYFVEKEGFNKLGSTGSGATGGRPNFIAEMPIQKNGEPLAFPTGKEHMWVAGESQMPLSDVSLYKKDWLQGYKKVSNNLETEPFNLFNIRTSISPELRQGLRTVGPSFNNEKRIVHTLDDLEITPQDEIQELHNNLLNKFNTEEGKRRLGLLGIDNSKLNPATLSFKSTGSGYFPTDNTLDIDLEEAIKLNMDPQTIYAHEIGHWLGKQYGEQSPTLMRQKFYETPIDKEFIASYPENFVDEMLVKNPNVDFNKISKESSAVYMLNQKDEAFPFLREMRQNMLNKGYINDEYDYIPEETINKFIKENPSYDRISSFTEPNSKQSKHIYQQFKDLPAVVPVAIGLGAASQMEKQKDGGVIKDDMGQWDHPGEITEIGSNEITMQGVPYNVLGVSDTGDTKLMKPGKDYKFKGKKVTEYPMAKNGVNQQDQKTLQHIDQLTNFTNYNTKQPGGWLDTL